MLDERSSKASRSVIIILTGGIIFLLSFLTMFLASFGIPASAYPFTTLIQTTLAFLLSFLTMFSVGFRLPTSVHSIAFVIEVATLVSIAGLHFFVAKRVSSGKIQKRIIIYAFVIFDLLVILAFFLGAYFLFFPMVRFDV